MWLSYRPALLFSTARPYRKLPVQQESDELHPCGMSSGACEVAIVGKQRCVKNFCERYVGSIVAAEIVAQLPHPWQQRRVRVAPERERRQQRKNLISMRVGDFAAPGIA